MMFVEASGFSEQERPGDRRDSRRLVATASDAIERGFRIRAREQLELELRFESSIFEPIHLLRLDGFTTADARVQAQFLRLLRVVSLQEVEIARGRRFRLEMRQKRAGEHDVEAICEVEPGALQALAGERSRLLDLAHRCQRAQLEVQR